MANEMKSMTFGGVTHPIYDNDAIKSASMTGSNLELKDGAGNVKSTVVIPTGGVKYTTFLVGMNNATYGDLCYIDPTPLTGAQPGEFIYVNPMVTTATAFGYFLNAQQRAHGSDLVVYGIDIAPLNQPLILMVTENSNGLVRAQYVPASPRYSIEELIADKSMSVLDAWKALTSWKPGYAIISSAKAANLYSATNVQYAYAASAVNSNYRKIFVYQDGTYASLIPLASDQDSLTLDHAQQDYTNNPTYTIPNPCIDEPEAITVVYGDDTIFVSPLDTDGTIGELVTADGRGSDHMPSNFTIVFGHWI